MMMLTFVGTYNLIVSKLLNIVLAIRLANLNGAILLNSSAISATLNLNQAQGKQLPAYLLLGFARALSRLLGGFPIALPSKRKGSLEPV